MFPQIKRRNIEEKRRKEKKNKKPISISFKRNGSHKHPEGTAGPRNKNRRTYGVNRRKFNIESNNQRKMKRRRNLMFTWTI